MDRRKELKELYKTIKPDMGVFVIRSIKDNKCYIHGTRDLKSFINRVKFQLNLGVIQTRSFKGIGRAMANRALS